MTTTNAYFNLFQSNKNNLWYWNLTAPNHEIILQSKGYAKKSDALRDINATRIHAPLDERYERLDANDGKPMFKLYDDCKNLLGWSETYESKAGRDNGIEACKKYAPDAKLVDLSDSATEAQTVSTVESAGGLSILAKHGKKDCAIPVKPKKGGYYGNY